MAIVKGLSLEAVRTLGKAVTFSTWKGLQIAKAKVGKRGPATSLKHIYTNTRFKIANFQMHQLETSVIDLWKEYVVGTDWTWKDAFISAFLRHWGEFNCPPQVITALTFSWGSPIAQLAFKIATYYLPDPNGYSNDAYGLTPFGAPEFFLDNQPFKLYQCYEFSYSAPLPDAYTTYQPPSAKTGCKKPPKVPDSDSNTVPPFTPSPTSIPITHISSDIRSSGRRELVGCQPTFDQAWLDWKDNPQWLGIQPGSIHLQDHIFLVAGAIWRCTLTSAIGTYRADINNYIESWQWPLIDRIELSLPAPWPGGLDPWAPIITVENIPFTISPGTQQIPLPLIHPGTGSITMEVTTNQSKPPTLCPVGGLAQSIMTFPSSLTVYWKPQLSQTFNIDANPPPVPFVIRPTECDGHPPLLSPPLLVTEEP